MGTIDPATAARMTTFVLLQKEQKPSITKEELRAAVAQEFPGTHISNTLFNDVFDLADGKIQNSVARKGFEGPLGAEFKNVLAGMLGVEPEAITVGTDGSVSVACGDNTAAVKQGFNRLPEAVKRHLGVTKLTTDAPSLNISGRVTEMFASFSHITNQTDKGDFFHKRLGPNVTNAEFNEGIKLLDTHEARQAFRTAHITNAKDATAIANAQKLVTESAIESAQARLCNKKPPVDSFKLEDGTLIVGDNNSTADATEILLQEFPSQATPPSVKSFDKYVSDLIPGATVDRTNGEITICLPPNTTSGQGANINDVCKELYGKEVKFETQAAATEPAASVNTNPLTVSKTFKENETALKGLVSTLQTPSDFKHFQAFLREQAGYTGPKNAAGGEDGKIGNGTMGAANRYISKHGQEKLASDFATWKDDRNNAEKMRSATAAPSKSAPQTTNRADVQRQKAAAPDEPTPAPSDTKEVNKSDSSVEARVLTNDFSKASYAEKNKAVRNLAVASLLRQEMEQETRTYNGKVASSQTHSLKDTFFNSANEGAAGNNLLYGLFEGNARATGNANYALSLCGFTEKEISSMISRDGREVTIKSLPQNTANLLTKYGIDKSSLQKILSEHSGFKHIKFTVD